MGFKVLNLLYPAAVNTDKSEVNDRLLKQCKLKDTKFKKIKYDKCYIICIF